VAIHDSGSYVAFADPTTCAPLLSTGSLTGDYALTVTSATAPTAAGLHATYDGDVTTTQMVEDFFGDVVTASDVVGGDYDFSYQGGNYVQNTTGETGDVKAVACTVTVNKPANQTSVLNAAISPLQVTVTSNYPTNDLQFGATNLPKGLSIDPAAGKITGTPTATGTEAVTVEAINAGFSTDAAQCDGTATFNWTVSQTAASGSSNAFPKGGVQTGGGKPTTSPWLPFGIVLAGLATLLVGTAGAVGFRRSRTQQTR
jgi:hypothetical protein